MAIDADYMISPMLAASERLVLLGIDDQELRDYGMLLFHAGLYGRAFEYLNAYSTSLVTALSVSRVYA